jgi:phage recombination protein Bet
MSLINTNEIGQMATIWQSDEHRKAIRESFGKGLSEKEFEVFVQLGMATGLNPFLKEMWAVKFGDSAAQIFVGRDGYRKVISKSPNYDCHTAEAVYENDEFDYDSSTGLVKHKYNFKNRGKLVGAYALVWMKSSSRPFFSWAELSEYDKNQSLWKTMKATMIKKVAEAQAIRMACTALNGTYSEEEAWVDRNGRVIESANSNAYQLNEKLDLKPKVIEPELDDDVVMFTFDEVKAKLQNAKNFDELQEAASLVGDLNLEAESKSELSAIYRESQARLKGE